MPKLGDTKLRGHKRIVWHACERCGKERWVALIKGEPVCLYCLSCHPGGRKVIGRCVTVGGYIIINITPASPFYEMRSSKNRILEHRLVMAQALGRCLLSSEHVHHLNGMKDDNRVENLQLISQANHTLVSAMCSNCELRMEIRLLRWQVRELATLLQGKVESLCT